jgi:hypothetical protein
MSSSRSRAAATLLQRFPPRRSRTDTQLVLNLCDDTFASDAERLGFLDEFVSAVDLQVRPLVCPRSQGVLAQGGEHVCFPTEYNRDGDMHRCVHCNEFVHLLADQESGALAATAAVPTGYIRQMESIGNSLFSEYTAQYYGRDAKCNVIVWSTALTDDEVFPLGVAVLVFHRQGLGGQPEGREIDESGGTWASTHVVSVEQLGDQLHYLLHTSVYLDVDSRASGSAPATRFNGFLSQPSRAFSAAARRPKAGQGLPEADSIMADIGEKIQAVENSVRGRIDELYFSQAGHILSRLRTGGKKQPARATEEQTTAASLSKRNISSEESAGPEKTGGAPGEIETSSGLDEVPITRSKKKKKKPLWEAFQDEEGNTYYYNNETGDTSWEMPAELLAAEGREAPGAEEGAKDEAIQQQVQQLPEVLEVLSSLNLSKETPEAYYQAMRGYCKSTGTKLTVSRLTMLLDEQVAGEDGAPSRSALEVIVPAFGDRKKITTWIRGQS